MSNLSGMTPKLQLRGTDGLAEMLLHCNAVEKDGEITVTGPIVLRVEIEKVMEARCFTPVSPFLPVDNGLYASRWRPGIQRFTTVAVKAWMWLHVEEFRERGDINLTALAEACADHYGQADEGGPLDDPGHWIWECAAEFGE